MHHIACMFMLMNLAFLCSTSFRIDPHPPPPPPHTVIFWQILLSANAEGCTVLVESLYEEWHLLFINKLIICAEIVCVCCALRFASQCGEIEPIWGGKKDRQHCMLQNITFAIYLDSFRCLFRKNSQRYPSLHKNKTTSIKIVAIKV